MEHTGAARYLRVKQDMATPTVFLRDVTAEETKEYNDFFRAGVLAHPDSFRIVLEDFAESPFDPSVSANGFTLLATTVDAEKWLGVVSVERESGRAKRRHIAWLVRMYVAESAAGQGIGRQLLRAAIAQARTGLDGVEQLNLTVLAGNEPAKRLYLSEGFTVFAQEPNALRDAQGVYYAEEQMRLSLTASR